MLVRTGDDGSSSASRIDYRARCDDGNSFVHRIEFLRRSTSTATNSFQDEGVIKWTFRVSRERAKGRTSIDGGLRSSGRWTGNFRLRVKIRRNGRVIATCRSGRVGWRASPR